MATPTESDTNAKPEWAMSRREAENAARLREGIPAKRKKWPWVVLAIALVGGGYYFYDKSQKAALEASTAAAALATAAAAEEVRLQINSAEYADLAPITLQRTVKVIGNLQPSRTVTLAAEVSGTVNELNAREGDRVEAGSVLAQIDVAMLSLQVELARSNYEASRVQLEQGQANVARLEALVGRGAATTTALDEARTGVAAQTAGLQALADQIRSAELNLSKATVTAPFTASVSQRNVETGGFIGAGSPIFGLVDMSVMEMAANAPVSTSSEIKAGQEVQVSIDGIADRTFEGKVARINPVASAGSRTIPVYVEIDNPEGILLGGMFAIGQIVIAEVENAIAVPAAAVQQDAEGAYVLVIENETAQRRAVKTGEAWSGNMVQILEGLALGERIVTMPLSGLEAGSLVTVIEG